jgi:TPR repeat protein
MGGIVDVVEWETLAVEGAGEGLSLLRLLAESGNRAAMSRLADVLSSDPTMSGQAEEWSRRAAELAEVGGVTPVVDTRARVAGSHVARRRAEDGQPAGMVEYALSLFDGDVDEGRRWLARAVEVDAGQARDEIARWRSAAARNGEAQQVKFERILIALCDAAAGRQVLDRRDDAGQGTEADLEEIRCEAERSELAAMANLAAKLRSDPATHRQSLRLFEEVAAQAGSDAQTSWIAAAAMVNLAIALSSEDLAVARRWFAKAFETNRGAAERILGGFADEISELQSDLEKRRMWEMFAQLGDTASMSELARLVVADDPQVATRWLTVAAENGDRTGVVALAQLLYRQGSPLAGIWLERAAAADDPFALTVLGCQLRRRHPRLARRYLLRAAELDVPAAMYCLSVALRFRHPVQARHWLDRAVAVEYPAALSLRASQRFLRGDRAGAMDLYRRAEQLGDEFAKSQVNLHHRVTSRRSRRNARNGEAD